MAEPDRDSRATILLVSDTFAMAIGRVDRTTALDLSLIERLLRLRLAALRRGWSVRLENVDAKLAALVELVGVADLLLDDRDPRPKPLAPPAQGVGLQMPEPARRS